MPAREPAPLPAMDWASCRTLISGALEMLDRAGEDGSMTAIYLQQALDAAPAA